ncbi:MFS transporter [Paraburkholderia sp. B3]|uniref:MFS transporter n=1 Tax=Paraburkholderia sp. B3 TaxID=3134791 RepID=UPI003981F43A
MNTIDNRTSSQSNFLAYWVPVLATSAAFFMIVLDTSIVNLALARIGTDFHSNVASLQWLVDGYAMIFASLLLGSGAIGDRLGVKGIFMTGLLVFTIASGLCGVAPTMTSLQFARILQGVGAALLLPNSLAAINHTFLDATQRSKAIGAWASAGAVGIAVGPVLGGVLVQTLGWRSIFLVNLPVGLLALWMTHGHVPKAAHHVTRSLDPLGQLLGVATLASATYALISSGRPASHGAGLVASGVACVVFAGTFLIVEGRQKSPMLPLQLLTIRTLGPVSLAGSLHNVAIYGLIFVLSLKFQRLFDLTPMSAGLLFLPMTLALAGGTRIGTRILRKYSPFKPLIWGHLAAGFGVLLLAVPERLLVPQASILPLIIIGLGAGVTTPAMGLAVLDSVARSQGGLASGILNSARQAGGVIGVAVLGALLGDPVTLSGVRAAEYTAAIFLCAASLIAFLASQERGAKK